jgi:hypothetical protein
METNDFSKTKCSGAGTTPKTADKKAREFWLNLARRWEELSHARDGSNTNVRAARKLRLTRTIYSANRLASSEIIPQ